MSGENDFTWKVVVGGQGGVGKTTFLHRYISDEFIADTKLTVGVQFHSRVLDRHGKRIGLILWDLGGQERFRFVQDRYIRGAAAALVMFAMDRYESLLEVGNWVKMIRDNSSPSIPIILVGTKSDLMGESEQELARENAEEAVRELDLMGYICTSSKWGLNIVESINQLVDVLLFQKTEGRLGAIPQQTP